MKIERYLKIVNWAKRRYTRNAVLVIRVGHFPSRYSVIEDLAAKRYLEVA